MMFRTGMFLAVEEYMLLVLSERWQYRNMTLEERVLRIGWEDGEFSRDIYK